MLELAERSMGHRVSSDSRGYTMRRPTKKRLDRHTDHSAELFVLHQLELENGKTVQLQAPSLTVQRPNKEHPVPVQNSLECYGSNQY